MPVLDDTGKSLVLQKVAADLKEQLPAMGSLLHKQGYIHEVKSAISEFMQYGISTQDMDKLITSAQKRGALAMKLKDLKTLYRGFQDYIRDHFITTEETLDVLRRSLSKSKILKGSVVVFDGFTGFTPIQNRLIQELMRVCAETIVTVTIGVGEDPYKMDGEQKLFHLSKKTVADLEKLAAEAKTLGAVRLCREGTMFYLRDRFYTVTTKVRDLPEEKTLTSNLLPERDEVFSFFRWQQKAKAGNGTVRKNEKAEYDTAIRNGTRHRPDHSMEEIGALTAAIREEGLNVPSRGCRITSGQNDLPGVLIGALLRPGEPIEFHRPNTEYMENYFSTKAVLRDGKLFLPDCPGLPVRADLERLEADGLLNEKQTLLPKTI